MKKLLLGLFVLSIIFGASQQDVFSQGMEFALFEEIPMVALPTRIAKPITEAPAAIAVITAKDIAEAGYVDIWDLLRDQPGVNVEQVSGTTINVSIRGFGSKHASNKLAVYLDGRSIFNPTTQGVWWQQIPAMIEDIASIEIMRGPNPVMHGFNAFNGIISITTKDPAKTAGESKVKVTLGSHHNQQYYGSTSDTAGKLSYRVSYQKDNSQGLGEDHGRNYIDSSRLKQVNVNTSYDISDDKSLDVIAGGNQGHRGSVPINSSESAHIDQNYQIVKYSQILSDTSDIKIQGTNTYWNRNRDGVADSNDFTYWQRDISFQHSFVPMDKHQIVWGTELRRNESQATVYINNNAEAYHDTIVRGFIQDTIELTDKLTWYNGIEWAQNSYTGSDWSVRQTAMYNLTGDHHLRATYARAHHAHSFVEYWFNQSIDVGNIYGDKTNQNNLPFAGATDGDLTHESIDSYELGYRGTVLDGKLLFDAEVYYYDISKLQNGEVAASIPFLFLTFENSNAAKVKGFELAADYKPYSWLKTYANYSYMHLEDKKGFWDTVDPSHMIKAGATIYMDEKLLPSYADVKLAYISHTHTNDADRQPLPTTYPKYKVNGYIKLDVKLAKKLMEDKLELSITGLNLLKKKHYEWGNSGTSSLKEYVQRQFLVTAKYEF